METVAIQGKTPGKPEVAEGGEGFPLRLSRSARKSTIAWAIAGFDPSSGAGVTADLMTFAAHGVFGCSVITALTVQSTVGVFGWEAVSPELIAATLDRLQEDMPAAGCKIGMLGTVEAASAVGGFLQGLANAKQNQRPIAVLDPVLRSSSGRALFPEEGLETLHRELLPWVDVITPNWAELALLSGQQIQNLANAEAACRLLCDRHAGLSVVATGGDQGEPVDLLVQAGASAEVFRGERIETRSTHGTGCALSSALLCELMAGLGLSEAVGRAKRYVEGALRAAPGLGAGRGPMGLLWPLERG